MAVKKVDKKKIDSFEKIVLEGSYTDLLDCQKDNWVREQINPETLLEAKITKLMLASCRHIIRRRGSLENTIIPGNIERSRKRGRPNARWTDFIEEARGRSL